MTRHSKLFLFVLLSLVASSLNYLTYPILSRILADFDFVNTTVALSILSQMTTFLLSVTALTIGLTKSTTKEDIKQIIEVIQSQTLSMFLVLVAVFLLLSPLTLGSINLPILFAIPLSMLLIFSLPTSVFSGYMNGQKKLILLGFISVITSSLQLVFCIFFAILTKSGVVALTGMALGQLIATLVIIVCYRNQSLPKISIRKLRHDLFLNKSKKIKYIGHITISGGIGLILINLAQIADLLIIKRRPDVALFYSNLYILSQMVFFASLIFIWPFLSEIDVKNKKENLKPFTKLFTIVISIATLSVATISLFGNTLTQILFNTTYNINDLSDIGSLVIIYRTIYVFLIAFTLFFIVIRKYTALYVPVLITLLMLAYIYVTGLDAPVDKLLKGLITIGVVGLFTYITIYVLFTNHRSKP